MSPSMAYDALIVGGGPGGLYAAWRLAHDGFSVVVCEEHDAVGVPIHCTGVLGADSFDEFDLPRETVLNALPTIRFVSPAGLELRYTAPAVQAVVIDRGLFDRILADRARAAGAELRVHARVDMAPIRTWGPSRRSTGTAQAKPPGATAAPKCTSTSPSARTGSSRCAVCRYRRGRPRPNRRCSA